MKEVKPSKKPLAIYYAIVLAVLLLLNLVLLPWMSERQVEEVDYGTFMTMTEEKNIGRVDIESNQIIFTDKEEKQVYKTGLMNDPELTQRLYDAGAQFSIIFFVVKIFGIHAGIFFAVQNIGKGHPLQLPFLTNRRGQVGGCVRQDKITHVRAHLP